MTSPGGLSEVADEAPDPVLQEFATKIASRLRTDSEAALRTRPATDPKEATRGVSWVAAQMLSNAPWLPEHMHSDLLRWALEAWLSDPPSDSMPALQGVAWLHSSGRRTKPPSGQYWREFEARAGSRHQVTT
ncbi:MAG: hypothetical protein Ct9H300mP30_5030 [Methanobacteriota archaeon]|nr:MAG: hypothetical protein Ct9H300mP30_5030 [Euryarchaeota archaeon]